jgi:hypothetical protein
MSNPYQSPAFDPKQFQDQPVYVTTAVSDYGWVNQVRTFAILNAVQGLLEIPMGCMTTGMGAALPAMIRMGKAKNPGGPPLTASDETMLWVLSLVYLGIGLPVFTSGILRIIAGWKNYRFKGRTLGMISIIAGLATMFSCYCAPTAVGLLVYGLIIFVNPAVKAAFGMARQGRSPEQILAAFNPYQPTYYPPSRSSPIAGGSTTGDPPPAEG